MPNCPICTAKADRVRCLAYDDRYAYPGSFAVISCDQCRHLFTFAQSGAINDAHLYTDYYPRASYDLANFAPKRFPGGFRSWLNGDDSAACRWVPPGAKILDIGCGFGETLAYHQARGCDACGVEMDENVGSFAERFRLNIRIGPFDPNCYPAESFDYVTMQQVLEHVESPPETLQGVARVLAPGGCVVVSTPNPHGWGARLFGHRWINWHVPYHRHYFSRSSMALAAQAAGLQLASVRTVTSSEWLRYQWAHLLSFPGEGTPSPFWSPRGIRTLPVKVGEKLFDLLHHIRLNHLFTRLFDEIGAGDNFLFLLKKPG